MKKLYTRWKNISEKIGNFQATILFSFLYFVVVTPIGLVSGLFKDFLSIKYKPKWESIEDRVSTEDKLNHQ